MQSPDYKRSIGYDFASWESQDAVADAVPRVRWLRFQFASATSQGAAPHEILSSYNAWLSWRDSARKVRTCSHPPPLRTRCV